MTVGASGMELVLVSVRSAVLLALAVWLHRQGRRPRRRGDAEGRRAMRAGATLVLAGSVLDTAATGAWQGAAFSFLAHGPGYVGGLALFAYGAGRLASLGRGPTAGGERTDSGSASVLGELDAARAEDARRIGELTTALVAAVEGRRRAELDCQAKAAFLARMSHELRTPLTTVLGFADVVRSELFGPIGNPRYREYLQGIANSGRDLARRLADVLDLCEVEAGRLELDVAPVRLHDLVPACLQMLAESALRRGCVLDFTDEGDCTLRADPRRLKQIVLNLLDEALERSGEGGRILVGVSRSEGGVLLRVDDGRNEPGPRRSLDAEDGSLAMALTASLAAMHGGRLIRRATPSGGFEALLWLPAAPPFDTAVQ